MPGIGLQSAQRIIAEVGIVMEQFPSADHFASWCGIVPACNESAGKKKNSRIRKGNKFIKETIVECARAAIRNKNSYYYAKYCKIAARRGGKRALIAVAHSMLLAIYHILKKKQHFVDLGNDYFNTLNAERILKRNLRSLHDLGYEVELSPLSPA
ncbi:transposase [Desulfitobacterium sp. AusDCA]|uniref:transposase n=2 Tax=Desulfitobacterium sp. AusDCA TaxID=3240383 RepID=UPI003DA76F18